MNLKPDHLTSDLSDTAWRGTLWKNPALASFTITLILFSIQLFFIKPFYLVNDDIFKILTVKGITTSGEASPFIGYSNVLLGYILKALFHWDQTFPWYSWTLLLTQFVSFWVLLWLLLLGEDRWFKTTLFIGLWVGVYFIFFVFLQFTITALLAAQIGLCVFLRADRWVADGSAKMILIAGTFLLWAAALIRMDSLGLAFLMVLPLILFRIFDPSWLSWLRQNRRLAAVTGAGLLGLILFNTLWFRSDPAWREYQRFDQARVELQDYHVPFYTPQTKSVFDSVNWSENDLWLFKNWYYANPEKFNADTFKKIAAFFPRWGSEGKLASFHSLEELVTSFWDGRILLFFLLLLLFCAGEVRKKLFLQLVWLFAIVIGLIYLLRAPDRVTLPLLVFSVNLALIEAEKPSFKGQQRIFSGIAVILLVGMVLTSVPLLKNYYEQSSQRLKSQAALHYFLDQVHPKPDELYEICQFPFEALGAFDDFECLRPFHLFLAVFSETSPASMNGLEKFGVREPFRDAVDNPRVLLMCSTEEGIHYYQYIKENFHKTIYARPVFKCEAFQIFSIHSKK